MNSTIFRTTLKERLSHPVRLGGLLGVFLLPLLTTIADPQPAIADTFWAAAFAVVLASGLFGLEISSGAMLLVFTRPITRSSYVLSRFAAVAAAAVALSLLQLACQAALIRARGGDIPADLFAFAAADRAFLAVGVASVFALFSSVGSSVADLFLWAGGNVLAAALEASGRAASVPAAQWAGRAIEASMNPRLDLYRVMFSSPPGWSELLRYAATVLMCLTISISLMNRKELSYATG